MISSADEFVALRTGGPGEQWRASHEEANEEVWLEVIERYPEFRTWVAHNKSIPISIVTVLAADADPGVRYSVAVKRKLSPRLFEQLAADADSSVRHAVACNIKTPQHLRLALCHDVERFVADAAAERASTPSA